MTNRKKGFSLKRLGVIGYATLWVVLFLTILWMTNLVNAETYLLYNDNDTGYGNAVTLTTGNEFRTYSCDVITSDNATTSATVSLQGNQGGTKYDGIGLATHTATFTGDYVKSFSVVDMPIRQVRAQLVSVVGGTNPVITVRCTGVK